MAPLLNHHPSDPYMDPTTHATPTDLSGGRRTPLWRSVDGSPPPWRRIIGVLPSKPDPLSTAFLHHQLPPVDLSSVDTTTHTLLRRQNNVIGIIPTGYSNQNDSPLPGTVAGIVLGTVAGVIFIAYLIWVTATRNQRSTTIVEEVDISERESSRTRSRSRRRSHAKGRPARRDTIHIVQSDFVEKSASSRSASEVRAAPSEQPPQVIREVHERVEVRDRQRSPSPIPSMQDEVLVIEEESSVTEPPRRKKSSRKTTTTTERTTEKVKERDESRRRSSGVRYVDPNQFAGGSSRPYEPRRSSRLYD